MAAAIAASLRSAAVRCVCRDDSLIAVSVHLLAACTCRPCLEGLGGLGRLWEGLGGLGLERQFGPKKLVFAIAPLGHTCKASKYSRTPRP